MKLATTLVALISTVALAAPPEEMPEKSNRHFVNASAEEAARWLAAPPVSVPTVHVGEMANNEVLPVAVEFYVNGEDLDPNADAIAFDYVNLTPGCAKVKAASTPTNGFTFIPLPNVVCTAQAKVVFGNSAGVFEKVVEVRVLPAGSITLHVEAGYDLNLYDTGYEP